MGLSPHLLPRFRQRRVSNFEDNYLIFPLMWRERHPPPIMSASQVSLGVFNPQVGLCGLSCRTSTRPIMAGDPTFTEGRRCHM